MNRLALRSTLAGCALLGALTLSSCTSARNVLGPHASPCFRVLPAALLAVHGEGKFTGIKYVAGDVLLTAIRKSHFLQQHKPVPPALMIDRKTSVCLVGFRGDFQVSSVNDGWSPSGAATGKYAVVVVRQRDTRVLITAVLTKEPLRFARIFPTLH